MSFLTHVAQGKRARPLSSSQNNNNDNLLLISNLHQLAYWGQWRLAISAACAGFDSAGEEEADVAWSLQRRHEICVANQAKLCSEIRHLEAQLGRTTSVNAKLEAAQSEKAEALVKLEKELLAVTASVGRLQIQLARQHEAAALSNTKLEERLSLASVNLHSLEARLRDIEDAKQTSTEKYTELTRKCLSLEDELAQARQRVADLTAESQIERARTDTLQGDLAALRDKYSALKRRMAEAGRKVESVRTERDALRCDCAALEDKLADVEKFQMSERGRALNRMEQELAEAKMARVELEADRDELQTQLAAALQTAGKT